MPHNSWLPSKSSLLMTVFSLALGLTGGWYTSSYFASEQMREAVKKAEEDGRIKGVAAGTVEAQRAFESTAPDRLEEMFGDVFEAIRQDSKDAGFAEGLKEGQSISDDVSYNNGYNLGFEEGEKAGYSAGQSDAVNQQLTIIQRLDEAQRDWQAYQRLLEDLASISRELEGNLGNEEIENLLIGRARGVTGIAYDLEEAHRDQASSFNSIMEELRRAVEVRNLPRIRQLSYALESNLEAKFGLYISGKKAALESFQTLRSN